MSIRNTKTATVFGATGFVGRQVVRELAARGVVVKAVTRVPERAYFLKPFGAVGQIVPLTCDFSDMKSIAGVIEGSDYVVNCIGILFEKRKGDFEKIHSNLPAMIATACRKKNVRRFVHISALGVERGKSRYAYTKLAGEKAARQNYPNVTILRPSVIFGEDDEFFNMFARMAQVLPFLPLIGGGHTRFQPVFVGDVADGVMAALEKPCVGAGNPQGRIYELGGPEVVDFRQIYEILFHYTGRRRALIALPWRLAMVQAWFMEFLPKPPLTRDQVISLKSDNIVADKALSLKDLGISARAMDSILPEYLCQYCPEGVRAPA